MRTLTVCITAAAFLTAAGCGSDNGLDLARVSGKITYKGEPITFGSVMFEPEKAGPPAVGTIGTDGSFVLSTESPGDGAVVGTHRIAIVALEDPGKATQAALPDPQTSPREFMIAKSKIATRPARADKPGNAASPVTIPDWLGKPATSNLQVKIARGSNTVLIDIKEDGSAQVTP